MLAKLILYLAIPWGLMPIFVPMSPVDPNYYPQSEWTAFRVQIWKSKSWVAQFLVIEKMRQSDDDSQDALFTSAPLPNTVPVSGVGCANIESCLNSGRNLTGDECEAFQEKNRFYYEQKMQIFMLPSKIRIVYKEMMQP
jgi:hypothetical protein